MAQIHNFSPFLVIVDLACRKYIQYLKGYRSLRCLLGIVVFLIVFVSIDL